MNKKEFSSSRIPSNDLMGYAMWEYVQGNPHDLITWTSITPPEIFRTAYLFRSYDEMPSHEQKALQLARGKILDIGAGSGSHSLYLQEQGKKVTALERSPYAVKTMQKRGVKNIIHQDFFRFTPAQTYDTLLLLMNGAGIMGTINRADAFFGQLNRLLAPGGQILLHTSDISYVYFAYNLPLPLDKYYGEVTFYIKYRNRCGEPFPWLYFDFFTLQRLAAPYGFKTERLAEDDFGDMLVRMWR